MSKNLPLLSLIAASRGFLLSLPIITLFWIDRGLSMTDIFVLQSIFAAVIVIAEVPSGYFADRFGHKKSITLGAFLYFCGILGYAFAGNFYQFIGPEILLGLGKSLISGADSALLFNTLKALKRQDEYKKWEGKFFAYSSYSVGIAGIIGAFLWQYKPEVVMLTTAMIMIVPIIISLFLKDIASGKKKKAEESSLKETLLYGLIEKKILRGIFVVAAAIAIGSWASVWYSQLHWQSLAIPVQYFGIIWAVLMLIKGSIAQLSHHLEEKLGLIKSLFFILGLLFFGYILLGVFPSKIWIIFCFIPILSTHALIVPIIKNAIQVHAPDDRRATLLSLHSLVNRFAVILIGPSFGYIFDLYSFSVAFFYTAILCAFFGLYGIYLLKKY